MTKQSLHLALRIEIVGRYCFFPQNASLPHIHITNPEMRTNILTKMHSIIYIDNGHPWLKMLFSQREMLACISNEFWRLDFPCTLESAVALRIYKSMDVLKRKFV